MYAPRMRTVIEEATDLAPELFSARWSFRSDAVDAMLGTLGYAFDRVDDDRLLYASAGRPAAVVRQSAGVVSSVAFVLARSPWPHELEDEEAEWDALAEKIAGDYEAAARALQARLGSPSFHGTPARGKTWDGWADRMVLWPAARAWLSLQERQDDTDVPLELVLVVAPPNHVRVPLEVAPLPEKAAPPPEPPATPPQPPAAAGDEEEDDRSLVEALAEKALALKHEGRFDEALEVMGEVTQLAPLWGAAWNDLGTIHGAKRATAQALACFDRAIAVDPGILEMAVANRVRACHEGGILRARYEALVAKDREGLTTLEELYELGFVLRAQGQMPVARAVFTRFVARASPAHAALVAELRAWLRGPAFR